MTDSNQTPADDSAPESLFSDADLRAFLEAQPDDDLPLDLVRFMRAVRTVVRSMEAAGFSPDDALHVGEHIIARQLLIIARPEEG